MKQINNVAVLGLGTMGHGIAQAFATSGCTVRGYDEQEQARAALIERVRSNLEHMVAAGLVVGDSIEATLARITVCSSEADAVAEAEFVTEAVSEDLLLKQELFPQLEAFVADNTILASNTSTYPITDVAYRMRRPERAIITHWFNPPHVVPAVEVVPGEKTSEETTQTAYDLLQRIGKLAIRVRKEIPGFLVNRIQMAMIREVWDLLDRGIASAEDIDRAVRGSVGLRLAALGPLAIIDFAGWDVTSRVYENLAPDLRSDAEIPGRISQLLSDGRIGVKAGRGVYEYSPDVARERTAQRDRTYLALIKALREQSERGSQ
jgi:3-hydroxyacyl-CoA dehydrogenase